MQDGGHQHKWKERSRIGIYLGRSPDHAINVALVLDWTTGLLYPQYHVQFDRTFDTVQDKSRGTLDLNWQLKAGFVWKVTPPKWPAESDQLTGRSHKRARLTAPDGPQQPKTSMQQLAPVEGGSSSTIDGPQKSIGLEQHTNSVHFSEEVSTNKNKQLPMNPLTPVIKPIAPQTLLRAVNLEISIAQLSIVGEILAYTQANDEGRDLQGDPI